MGDGGVHMREKKETKTHMILSPWDSVETFPAQTTILQINNAVYDRKGNHRWC